MKFWLSCLALVFVTGTSLAIDTSESFDDPELQARYEKIVEEVRCLKCQNATLKDSPATLAADLRREIRRMLEEGMSDDEIYDFLVDRYGDFALYRPRASGSTLVLWVIPALLLLGGAFMLANIVRQRMAMPIGDDVAEKD
jgi:cytochrome c-type biogenesis protein CcmH